MLKPTKSKRAVIIMAETPSVDISKIKHPVAKNGCDTISFDPKLHQACVNVSAADMHSEVLPIFSLGVKIGKVDVDDMYAVRSRLDKLKMSFPTDDDVINVLNQVDIAFLGFNKYEFSNFKIAKILQIPEIEYIVNELSPDKWKVMVPAAMFEHIAFVNTYFDYDEDDAEFLRVCCGLIRAEEPFERWQFYSLCELINSIQDEFKPTEKEREYAEELNVWFNRQIDNFTSKSKRYESELKAEADAQRAQRKLERNSVLTSDPFENCEKLL